jgi:hypothetical protein
MRGLRHSVGLWVVFASWSALASGQQRLSLPLVRRDVRQPVSVFTKPALIGRASIRDKCLLEETDIDRVSFKPPRVHREVIAWLDNWIRINERLSFQPDLHENRFALKMDETDIRSDVWKRLHLDGELCSDRSRGSLDVHISATTLRAGVHRWRL